MRNTIEAARACGMLNDSGRLLDEEEFGFLPPDKVMLLCTGSQGEPRAVAIIRDITKRKRAEESLRDSEARFRLRRRRCKRLRTSDRARGSGRPRRAA